MAGQNRVDFRLIIIIVATVIIATMGSAYSTYIFLSRWHEANGLGTVAAEPKGNGASFGYTYNAGDFTVNILDERGTGTRFMRTGVVLAADTEEIIKELERRAPQVRDVIISGLRSRTYQEVLSPNGMNLLKQDVLDSLNSILGHYKISDVYFTDFVLQ